MYIESLQLRNYRNYRELDLELDPKTNILYGDNAQGKTNILEALYLCGTTKSHRGSKDREIIAFDEDEAHIRMYVHKDELTYKVDMHLKKNKAKGVAINGLPIRRARELFGIVNFVFFSPEDLNIIKNGPGERRRFLDMELCQLDPLYLTCLGNYNQAVNQRNKLLKDLYVNPSLRDTLDVWDSQIVQYGLQLIRIRRKFIGELNDIIGDIHLGLTDGKEKLILAYEPSADEEEFEALLLKNREKDMKLKMTSVGPHRDDLRLTANEIDIRRFGSQGQQRTAALSLKLSEIHMVRLKTGDTPILLLDDVLSELDSSRQKCLLQSIHDIQTVITCTGLDDFVSHQFQVNKVFNVVKGQICRP